jgi:hypothetical protein
MLAFIGEHIGHCRHGACTYPSLTGVSARSRLPHTRRTALRAFDLLLLDACATGTAAQPAECCRFMS